MRVQGGWDLAVVQASSDPPAAGLSGHRCCCRIGMGQLPVEPRPTQQLWETVLVVGLGDRPLALDLRHWVNEGLMTIFFFVVGLRSSGTW
jgi:hypothetical protein